MYDINKHDLVDIFNHTVIKEEEDERRCVRVFNRFNNETDVIEEIRLTVHRSNN